MTEQAAILVINAGSSSIKFALFETGLVRLLGGELEGVGEEPRLQVTLNGGTDGVSEDWSGAGTDDVAGLIQRLLGWIESRLGRRKLAAIGHRVATGGLEHSGPALVTPIVLQKLRALVELAPLHQPRNLEPIELLNVSHPTIPQIACFDTAFHGTLPREAQLFGLPQELADAGAIRYGFHGLSYEFIAGRLPDLDQRAASGRTIVCHLGSGASLCAMRASRSVATTMGFSPLSGLMMATRPGDLDPGLLIWLLRERGMEVDDVEHMLYHDAGLKGVSGLSGDMRSLLVSDNPKAEDAIGLFVYRVITWIGHLAAALGGLDALVFTAGIGEHAPEIRRRICERCGWLDLHIDAALNEANATRISSPESRVSVWVVPTDEERMIAQHATRLLDHITASEREVLA